ncbi:MAG: hypothetical protein ABIK92_21770 [Pseudomonadota bacterium]
MAILAQTISEGRTDVLDRVGAPNSSDFQAVALRKMNQALNYITNYRDWSFARKKTTVTTSDATGVIAMPDDLSRILSIYKTGENVLITRLDPLPFCQAKEDTSLTDPTFFCYVEPSQDTSVEAPHMNIEIYTAPAINTTYQLWYTKIFNEWITADLSTVPLLPPFIWELVLRKATYEMLKQIESDARKVNEEKAGFMEALVLAAQQEDQGSSQYDSIRTMPQTIVRKNRRFRR